MAVLGYVTVVVAVIGVLLSLGRAGRLSLGLWEVGYIPRAGDVSQRGRVIEARASGSPRDDVWPHQGG